MARRPRADWPGSWHHIITRNRGMAKRPLFEQRRDARFFLARLVRQIRLGRIEVHSYCLMRTHFHMLVRSPLGELSEAMRRVQNEHSRQFNPKHRRDGCLLRGRFFSKPVDSIEYRRTLVRYIDADPVRAGIVQASSEFEFGSARAYVCSSGPRWLSRDWVEAQACRLSGSEHFNAAAYLETIGVGNAQERVAIGELIDARLARPACDDPFDDRIVSRPAPPCAAPQSVFGFEGSREQQENAGAQKARGGPLEWLTLRRMGRHPVCVVSLWTIDEQAVPRWSHQAAGFNAD